MVTKKINDAIDTIMEIMMIFVFLVVFLNVITRSLFGRAWMWTEELSRYLFIWVSFIAGSMSLKKNEHLGIGSGLIRNIPERWKSIIDILGSLLAIVFAIVLIIYGYKVSLLLMVKRSPILSLPMGYVNLIIPISGVLLILNISLELIDRQKELIRNKKKEV